MVLLTGVTATFNVNAVIAGFGEGLQLMSPGAEYEILIPWELAYGARGTGSIPAYSALRFRIVLESFEAVEAQPQIQQPYGGSY